MKKSKIFGGDKHICVTRKIFTPITLPGPVAAHRRGVRGQRLHLPGVPAAAGRRGEGRQLQLQPAQVDAGKKEALTTAQTITQIIAQSIALTSSNHL